MNVVWNDVEVGGTMISDGQALEWLEGQMEKAADRQDRAFSRLQVARAREAIMRNRVWSLECRMARAKLKAEGD